LKVALIQLNSGSHKEDNIRRVCNFIEKAVNGNAEFILLPEVFNYRGSINRHDLYNEIAENIPGVSTQKLIDLAKKHNIWIHCGSIYEKAPNKKIYNSSIVINNKGKIIAKYRKINLFKATVNNVVVDESKIFLAGTSPVIADVKGFKVGLSICFDLRFPELYRYYFNKNVDIIVVPSSFTTRTGKDHWRPLLQARAIENHSFVLAPNQFGIDGNNVETYGHTMFIDNNGKTKTMEKNEEGILYGIINNKNDSKNYSLNLSKNDA